MNRMKAAAEWFYSTVFKDESIQPRPVQQMERLPSMLRAMRSLEIRDHQIWQSRESIFLKQGKLLANYEDDYDFHGGRTHYYPTYQSLSDQELRGYFSWRTCLRRGDLRQTALSFAFLYIYELLNQIGVDSPEDGYQKLVDFRDAYGKLDVSILPYLKRWMADYVIYYGLDPELLSGLPQVVRDRNVTAVERIRELDGAEAVKAVKTLSSKWLARSRFYADHQADMDAVIIRVLRRMSDHCAARCKKSLAEQYFGSFALCHTRLFDAAVFGDPLKRRDYEYTVDEQCKYRCEKGIWFVWKRSLPSGSSAKLEDLLKTIDSVMRKESGYRHPVKAEVKTKWVLRIISEEVRKLAEEKEAAEEKKVSIDYSQLAKIRKDAAVTREKLIVEDEMDPPSIRQAPAPEYEQTGMVPLTVIREKEETPEEEPPLTPAEYRLVQCLLYGGDLGWVQAEGHLLSVLADGVNEKLYDTFRDTVLDDTPRLVEDYIDDLKEMVRP